MYVRCIQRGTLVLFCVFLVNPVNFFVKFGLLLALTEVSKYLGTSSVVGNFW